MMESLPNDYCGLLNTKLNYMNQIKELTKEQFDFIKKDEIDMLVENLKQRGSLMERIDAVTEQIEKFAQSDLDNAETLKIKAETSQILKEVAADNEVLKEKVLKLKEQCSEEIKKLNMQEKSARAYENADLSFGSIYFDKSK